MIDLILYDSGCKFCQRCISWILKHDHKEQFAFAPLSGETAKSILGPQSASFSTLVLVENFKQTSPQHLTKSKAVFKILWKLGGFYKVVGWTYILPSWLMDWGYDLVAQNRKRLCKKSAFCDFSANKKRFLP